MGRIIPLQRSLKYHKFLVKIWPTSWDIVCFLPCNFMFRIFKQVVTNVCQARQGSNELVITQLKLVQFLRCSFCFALEKMTWMNFLCLWALFRSLMTLTISVTLIITSLIWKRFAHSAAWWMMQWNVEQSTLWCFRMPTSPFLRPVIVLVASVTTHAHFSKPP